jgi:DNA-binding transcriptional regulator YiaG
MDMSNVAKAFRAEISRISRREVRKETETTRKSTTQHRHAIASLKGRVAQLERQMVALAQTVGRTQQPQAAADGNGVGQRKIRFTAKGLHAHRERLGLSAGDFGKLIGVSAQSVYSWEHGNSIPRSAQLEKISAIRALGKREAAKRLQ